MTKKFPDKWEYQNKKTAYPYEYFNSVEDCQKPVDNLKKKTFSVNWKKIFQKMMKWSEQKKLLVIKNGEQLTKIQFKKEVLLLDDVFENL